MDGSEDGQFTASSERVGKWKHLASWMPFEAERMEREYDPDAYPPGVWLTVCQRRPPSSAAGGDPRCVGRLIGSPIGYHGIEPTGTPARYGRIQLLHGPLQPRLRIDARGTRQVEPFRP